MISGLKCESDQFLEVSAESVFNIVNTSISGMNATFLNFQDSTLFAEDIVVENIFMEKTSLMLFESSSIDIRYSNFSKFQAFEIYSLLQFKTS